MSTLENLWYENITPFEDYLYGNENYQELLPIMAHDREKLSEGFSSEKTEWLEKYDTILNEIKTMIEVEASKFGFQLSSRLIFEIGI